MALPEIVLFADVNCTGDHTHVFETKAYIGENFNDKVSSFVILEGYWTFFADAEFGRPMGLKAPPGGTLGPGIYNSIEAFTALGPGTNDQLSSLRHVPKPLFP
jgi:Beta/Gamma crystallin